VDDPYYCEPSASAAGWTAIDTAFHRHRLLAAAGRAVHRTDYCDDAVTAFHRHRLLAAAGRAVHRTDYCDDAVYEIDGFTLAGPPSVDGGLFANGGLNVNQADAPFGANIGGVAAAFVAAVPTTAFDSWLTVGITGGDAAGALSSIGIDWDGWTASAGLSVDNGAVFWMSPGDGPSGSQLALRSRLTAGGHGAHRHQRVPHLRHRPLHERRQRAHLRDTERSSRRRDRRVLRTSTRT
jgi:hypothetical protein